ncbi:hypothetical protein F5B21DRAFT_521182 [Xylaria acuta]|nr:hypothetical protein F5B21DRAFT_521182 [Xylaria acuta]
MEVETLIPQMQDTLSEIRITVKGLSTKSQDDELDQLEQTRERLLADLQTSFEKERQERETRRRVKLEEIKKKRKQEDEERAARRQQEDQELDKINSDDDLQRQKKHDIEAGSIKDETGQKMNEIEEVVQKMIQQGKHKLQNLDEKRRVRISDIKKFAHRLKHILQELNRRIDEQLQQSLPTAPTRSKDTSKKGPGDTQKNGTVGSTPTVPRNTDLSPKSSNQPDALSNSQPPSATGSPAKPPGAKKDGELPFQERSDGPSQAAKDSTKNLPRSFAEAPKNDISNGLKGKPKLGKPSSDGLVQTETNRGERGNEIINIDESEELGAHIMATTLTSMEDVITRGSGGEDTGLFSDINSQLEKARPRGYDELSYRNPSAFQPKRRNHNQAELNILDSTIPQQNQSGSRSESAEEHGPTVSNVDRKRRTLIQRADDQLHIPITHGLETKQLRKSTAPSERSEASESGPGNGYAPNHLSKEEANIVEYSKTTFQPSRLSTTSKKQSPGRQDKETHDQVGLEQPATSDIFEQDHPEDGQDSSDTLRCLRASDQFSGTVLSPPIFMQGNPIVPLSRNVSDISPELGSSVAFEKSQDMTTKRLQIVGTQAREVLASPLPVENETVHGQDQLFDDNKSASDPSEPNTGDEHSNLSPYTPIEGKHLPVLLEPIFKDTLDDRGLTTLIDSSGSSAILIDEADEDRSRHLPSKISSTQEVAAFNQLDSKIRAGGCSKLRPNVNISQQPTRQDSSPITPSHNHIVLRERDHNPLRPPSQDTNSFNDQGPSFSQSAPVHMLYSQVLSDVVGSTSADRGSTAYDVTSIDSAKPKDKLRSDSVEPHPKRPKHRGRPRRRSFESPGRALNPRELLFQEIEDDINIRSAWFKHSKRRPG